MASVISYGELKTLCISSGASAFGIGYIEDLRPHFNALPLEQTEGLSYGISIGVRVSDSVLKGVITGPTRHYLHHYKMINMLLDQISLRLSISLQHMGYKALPIPASQIIDWQAQTAHLSHKMIALRSGLGWIGRNNLLVHPEYGSKIRLATVLTDMPMETDAPVGATRSLPVSGVDSLRVDGGCRECRKCLSVCPANAIGETYSGWDKAACLEKLKSFAKTHNIGQYICGLCVKVCDAGTTVS